MFPIDANVEEGPFGPELAPEDLIQLTDTVQVSLSEISFSEPDVTVIDIRSPVMRKRSPEKKDMGFWDG